MFSNTDAYPGRWKCLVWRRGDRLLPATFHWKNGQSNDDTRMVFLNLAGFRVEVLGDGATSGVVGFDGRRR